MEDRIAGRILIIKAVGSQSDGASRLLAAAGLSISEQALEAPRAAAGAERPEVLLYAAGQAGPRVRPAQLLGGLGLGQDIPLALLGAPQPGMEREGEAGWADILAWPCEPRALLARVAILLELGRGRSRTLDLERRLEAEIEDRRRAEASFRLNEERLDALLKLSEMHESSVEELAQYAIDACVRLTESRIGYLHFTNDTEDGFLSYTWSRGSREVCKAVERMDYGLDSAGIWADTLRFKKPLIHNDYPTEPSRRGLPQGHHPLLRHMGVPVLKEGRLVAIGGVANKESPYDASDLRQLLLFTNRLWSIIEAKRSKAELAEANAELSRLARTDGLTGIANRRTFDAFLEMQWRTAAREAASISLLMADIDCFKAYNDTYGHQAGDEVLKRVAAVIAGATRRLSDMAARYGGEEFSAILPSTGAESAMGLARSIVEGVAGLGIPHRHSTAAGIVSISVGVATLVPSRDGRESSDSLVGRADAALYEAKRAGKNRAVLASDSEPRPGGL
jgi:diguanylate cyclase (GGDEF)-like protein